MAALDVDVGVELIGPAVKLGGPRPLLLCFQALLRCDSGFPTRTGRPLLGLGRLPLRLKPDRLGLRAVLHCLSAPLLDLALTPRLDGEHQDDGKHDERDERDDDDQQGCHVGFLPDLPGSHTLRGRRSRGLGRGAGQPVAEGVGRRGPRPGLTCRRARALGRVMSATVDDRVIAGSPCQRIHLPVHNQAEVVPPTPEPVKGLAEAVSPRHRAAVVMLAGSGLRNGELLGLRKGDVDFRRGPVRGGTSQDPERSLVSR